jgi:hypothetical protein
MKLPVYISKLSGEKLSQDLFIAVTNAVNNNSGILQQIASHSGGKDPATALGRYIANVCNGILIGYNDRVEELETGEQQPPSSGIVLPN